MVVFSTIYCLYGDEDSKKYYLTDEKVNQWNKNMLDDSFVQKSIKEHPITLASYKILSSAVPSYSVCNDYVKTKSNKDVVESPTHGANPPDVLTANELQLAKDYWTNTQQLKRKPTVNPV